MHECYEVLRCCYVCERENSLFVLMYVSGKCVWSDYLHVIFWLEYIYVALANKIHQDCNTVFSGSWFVLIFLQEYIFVFLESFKNTDILRKIW